MSAQEITAERVGEAPLRGEHSSAIDSFGAGGRDVTNLIKAASLASESISRRCASHEANSFVADFSAAALEQLGL